VTDGRPTIAAGHPAVPAGRIVHAARAALRCLVPVLALLLAAGGAQACPVCLPAAGPSMAQSLARADGILLLAPERGGWRVQAVVKGTAAEAVPVGRLDAVTDGWAHVVLRDAADAPWRAVGAMPLEQRAWLQALVRAAVDPPSDVGSWQAHLARMLPALEHPSSWMAAVAHDEIARAPYERMRALAPQLDARLLVRWLDDPALGARAPLYTLLLGIAGGAPAVARIERQLARAARDGDATDLAARLVADLEMRPDRVRWIEVTYLQDARRSPAEVRAALLALSVQGQADGAVPRSRVVQAYRAFIRSGHPLAGYVAPDLAGWKDESAVPDYVALLARGTRQQPASTYAMLLYLEQSAQPAAREAARAERARRAR
jgi:hypothetical protein